MPDFTQRLLEWQLQNPRQLPWKNTTDAYTIWLSEIILQQTRVAQGLPYFLRFIEKYPTVVDLANASEDEVLLLWEGLGYYARARNMHQTARWISAQLNGVFPQTYEGIRGLKGVGDYTAAAIASFAFGLPYAVVDGNVYRVLSRYFGITTPIDTLAGKKQFADLAQTLLSAHNPGLFNQAMMDFGSLQCKPLNPDCPACPMQTSCIAYSTNQVSQLPVKSKKLLRKDRFFSYLVLTTPNGGLLLKKRTENDIWKNLYEFPLLETETEIPNEQLLKQHLGSINWLPAITVLYSTGRYKQLLTHQTIYARFFETTATQINPFVQQGFIEVAPEEINRYAFPKIINTYWQSRNPGKATQMQLPL